MNEKLLKDKLRPVFIKRPDEDTEYPAYIDERRQLIFTSWITTEFAKKYKKWTWRDFDSKENKDE